MREVHQPGSERLPAALQASSGAAAPPSSSGVPSSSSPAAGSGSWPPVGRSQGGAAWENSGGRDQVRTFGKKVPEHWFPGSRGATSGASSAKPPAVPGGSPPGLPPPFTQRTTLESQLGFAPPDPKRSLFSTGGRGGASPQQEAAILALTQRMASGVEASSMPCSSKPCWRQGRQDGSGGFPARAGAGQVVGMRLRNVQPFTR